MDKVSILRRLFVDGHINLQELITLAQDGEGKLAIPISKKELDDIINNGFIIVE